MKLSRVVLGSAVAVSLVGGGLMAMPVAAQDDCGVMINGGNVSNRDRHRSQRERWHRHRRCQRRQQQPGRRLVAAMVASGIDTASSGNGGVATAAANGGAISTGDINSGGNVGNAISVGNTTCAPVTLTSKLAKAPKEEKAPRKLSALKSSRCRIPALVSAIRQHSSC